LAALAGYALSLLGAGCTGDDGGDAERFDAPRSAETAFAYSSDATCFLDLGLGSWGWTMPMEEIVDVGRKFLLYADVGGCDPTSSGTRVGEVQLSRYAYDPTKLWVTYQGEGVLAETLRIHAGVGQTPVDDTGAATLAPSAYRVVKQYPPDGTYLAELTIDDLPVSPIYVIVRADIVPLYGGGGGGGGSGSTGP
jgi:hypothetical protein